MSNHEKKHTLLKAIGITAAAGAAAYGGYGYHLFIQMVLKVFHMDMGTDRNGWITVTDRMSSLIPLTVLNCMDIHLQIILILIAGWLPFMMQVRIIEA